MKRLRERPLLVNGRPLDVEVLSVDEPSIEVDLLILAVKAPQLPQALKEISVLVGKNTTVLSMLNGIDSERQIAAFYGWERTLYGFVVKIDAIRVGYEVRSMAKGRFVFGKENNEVISPRVAQTREIFERAGVDYEIPVDMIRKLWWKFMVNVGMNPPSAILRAPYLVFQKCKEARSLMNESFREVLAVASAEGIGLGEDDIASWNAILDKLDPAGKTSMLQDIEAGRRTEEDIFCGAVSRLGQKHGIPTPLNDYMHQMIQAIEFTFD